MFDYYLFMGLVLLLIIVLIALILVILNLVKNKTTFPTREESQRPIKMPNLDGGDKALTKKIEKYEKEIDRLKKENRILKEKLQQSVQQKYDEMSSIIQEMVNNLPESICEIIRFGRILYDIGFFKDTPYLQVFINIKKIYNLLNSRFNLKPLTEDPRDWERLLYTYFFPEGSGGIDYTSHYIEAVKKIFSEFEQVSKDWLYITVKVPMDKTGKIYFLDDVVGNDFDKELNIINDNNIYFLAMAKLIKALYC